jgi:hypothetical protein
VEGLARRGATSLGLALLLAVAIWAVWPQPTVRVVDATTRATLARLPIHDGAPLRLAYVHSIYRQPGVEEFAVGADGLALARIASPSLAVLEYYARPEPVAPAPEGYEIRIQPCDGPAPCAWQAAQPTLSVLVSALGRRTLSYAGRELPLDELAAESGHVTLQVGWAPRLVLLWTGAT